MPRPHPRDDDDEFEDDFDDAPAREPAGPPRPVRGRVVPASALKTLGLMVVCVGFIVVCGYMLVERWALPEDGGFLPFRLTWWGIALCVGAVAVCGLAMLVLPFELLWPKRLILGDEAFQVARRRGGEVTVEVHIPYANLRQVTYEQHGDEWRVGVDLRDPDDAGTYAKDPQDLRQADKKGRDYVLDGGYTESLKEISRLIEAKCRKTKRSRRDTDD